MAKVDWPRPDRRNLIGSRTSRLDGAPKATGAAKYAYDMNRENMLYARLVQAKPAVAEILNVDTSAAEALAGVEAVTVLRDRRGNLPTITYAGDIVCAVAATTEEIANEAARLVRIEYKTGTPVMDDRDQSLASGREQTKEQGDPAAGFAEADTISEGLYGAAAITHCCLEAHGQVMEFRDGELYVWPSTQSVSGYAGGVTRAAELSTDKIHVDCQYMGGGFGSKFASDAWGNIGVELCKRTGKPVKLMLERDQELKIAGHRPSAFAKVKVGVKNDGTITAWESDAWGSGGQQRWRMPPLPYVLTEIPNFKTKGLGIITNRGLTRAWRGPNHPQGALITMGALEDAAAAINMNPVDFFKKNVEYTERADAYREQIDLCSEMIGWKSKWHPRGQAGDGPVKRGLGMSIHTWGGQGHPSNCSVTVNPDGSVIGRMGTQDLGTGTRTVTTMVVADTLGLPMERVRMEIGKNDYPESGASGGSSTIGGVSTACRDAGTQALNALLEKVGPELNVHPDKLEAWDGKIQEIGNPSNNITWEDACSLLNGMPLTRSGSNPTTDGTKLTTNGVGGVQMADVSVDIDTGIVTINEFAAVQDCGLIIDLKTCESQMYGAAIMGITYALYEECVYDMTTGAMLNPDMEFYRLAGLGDIGEIKVHLQTDEKNNERGVIGIGEPPVISPGAAIANAVANATGVRVPELPLTPERVLNALSEEGVLS